MKKGNIIIILVVVFIVLLGVFYFGSSKEKKYNISKNKEIPMGPGHPLYDPTFEQEQEDISYENDDEGVNTVNTEENILNSGAHGSYGGQSDEEDVPNAGAHGSYGGQFNSEFSFSNDVYLNQPAYIKGIGQYDGVDVVKFDIIDSVSKQYPEADWNIVNESNTIHNYKISNNVNYFIGDNTTTKQTIIDYYLSGNLNNFVFISINNNGEVSSIVIPSIS
jgi:hypothetical protein